MSNSISPATTVQAALHLHQRGDVDAAESVYRRVLDAEPNNVDALHLLGMLLLEQGNPKKSETLLRSASTHAPSSGILANSLGVCLMRQARYNEALAQFQLALKFERSGVDVLQNMGEVCEKLQRFEEAIKYWERLLGIAPDHDEVRRLLASVLEDSGEIQQAAAHLFYVVCRDTAKERDVLALANLLQRNLQTEAVLSECRQRLSRNPDHVGLNQLVGCVLASRLSPTHAAQLSLPEQRELRLSAIAHLERAAEVRPSHLSYDLVGRNLMEIHCPEKAIVWFEKAVASNPAFAPAYECLGAALLSLGETDAATDAFERALKLYPRSPLANFELARLRQCPSEPTISQIKHELSSAKILRDDRILLHAALGHRYLSEEQPEAAWKHFCESGELKTDQEPRVCAEIYRADAIIESFPKARPLIRDNSSRPLSYKMIFIVGMPRSGTTLLEQILASHDSVTGCGELTFISSLA
ncbi:tetratricopeptide repeat-containing sulfotransferase family protein, partial [Rhodopirellula bahusiensis]